MRASTRGPLLVAIAALLLAPSLLAPELGATTAEPIDDTLDGNDSTTDDLEDASNETDETLSVDDSSENLTDDTGELLAGGDLVDDQPPCRPGPSADTVVCDLPPTCSTAFEGTSECEPPAACQRHGDDRILCVTERSNAASNASDDRQPSAGISATVEADDPDEVREQLRASASARLSSYRAQLDDLRERYGHGLDELRETYSSAKDALRDAYRACLAEQPADACREDALTRLSVLRDRLHDQRDALRASLIAEADHGAATVCAQIDAQYRALIQAGDLQASTGAKIRAATVPALCR